LASGETRSIRQLLDAAFEHLDLDWSEYVVIDEQFNRPTEATRICGDPSRAERELGWTREVSFEELVVMMVDHDLAGLRP
jgi:GDPmannose 4,6-dehydratase